MITLVLHKDMETISLWTSDPLIHYVECPIIPRGMSFHHGSQLFAPRLHTPSTSWFCLAIHSLPSILSSRIYRVLGHSIFPGCPSKFSLHPSSCSTPLEVDISGLHKLAYWHLVSSWFQPVGGISRRSELGGKEKLELFFPKCCNKGPMTWLSSLPAEQKFGSSFVLLLKAKFKDTENRLVVSNLGGEENDEWLLIDMGVWWVIKMFLN